MEHVWPRKPPPRSRRGVVSPASDVAENWATDAVGGEGAARALLAADSAMERRRHQRRAAVTGVALSGAFPMVALLRPAPVAPVLRALALAGWGALSALALAAGAAEWLARRRLARCADALAPTVGRR